MTIHVTIGGVFEILGGIVGLVFIVKILYLVWLMWLWDKL